MNGIVVRDPSVSDHFAVRCTLKLSKPRAEQREIRYRKLRSVDMSALCRDLRDSIVLQENITDLPTLVGKYETELTRVLDIHAPEKKRTITVRPAAALYNSDIDREKRKRRKLGRRWRNSRPVIDRKLYKEQCKVVSSLIKKTKENYYSNTIQENKGNQKILFNIVNRLLRSVLGSILYVLYMFPFGDVVRSHGLSCHFYADDTQLYCSFKLHDQATSVQAIESCINDIDAWMLANTLKLSKDKTELLVIGSKHKVNPPI